MIEETKKAMNRLLVEMFNHILSIEEDTIAKSGITDLTITEMHTLEAVESSQSKNMSDIALKLGITVSTLTTSINRLVKKEYVIKRKKENDKRVVNLELTEKGRQACRIHEEFHETMIDHLLQETSTMNEGDVQKLTVSFEKLAEFFKQLETDNRSKIK